MHHLVEIFLRDHWYFVSSEILSILNNLIKFQQKLVTPSNYIFCSSYLLIPLQSYLVALVTLKNHLYFLRMGKLGNPSDFNASQSFFCFPTFAANFSTEYFFKIGIHSIQGWTAITRHGVTRQRSTKRLKHIGNLFRKNLLLKDVC